MNFLAHQYLSGNDEELRIGNFIGDFVKGNKWKEYPIGIQNGILLHRSIDDFTDNNPHVRYAVKEIKGELKKYSAIALDIFFDHFLAKNWSKFSDVKLHDYVLDTYKIINKNLPLLPEKTAYVLQFMENQNWLYNYQFVSGIERTMNGMARRTKQPLLENSHRQLLKHYHVLEEKFFLFFPTLQEHVNDFINQKNGLINVE